MSIECEMEIFGHIGPFDDELITGQFEAAAERLKGLTGIEAVQLVLATFRRSDSVVGDKELDDLAEYLGVFVDDDIP